MDGFGSKWILEQMNTWFGKWVMNFESGILNFESRSTVRNINESTPQVGWTSEWVREQMNTWTNEYWSLKYSFLRTLVKGLASRSSPGTAKEEQMNRWTNEYLNFEVHVQPAEPTFCNLHQVTTLVLALFPLVESPQRSRLGGREGSKTWLFVNDYWLLTPVSRSKRCLFLHKPPP